MKKIYQILLAEDEKDLQDIYKLKFEKSNYKMTLANDGEEAMKIAKKQPFDLILLDIVMPKVSGFEFLREIKTDPKLKKIPIFILSNLGQENEIKEGIKLKADRYFIKANYTPEEIVAKVDEYFEIKK